MKKKPSSPIKVALHGMDARSEKNMTLYLKGPCQGMAVVVDASEAEIDIIDADFATAGELLAERRQKTPGRPIILLSLEPLALAGTHYLAKPVNAGQLSAMLRQLKTELGKTNHQERGKPIVTARPRQTIQAPPPSETAVPTPVKKRVLFKANEGGYAGFLGTLPDSLDLDDPRQLCWARFNPKDYFLGYILSAWKVAMHERRALRLACAWRPLLIFPERRQIWLEANDTQLRAFAGIEQSKTALSAFNRIAIEADETLDPAYFQDLEAFIWKVSIWTSKGRLPQDLALDEPVFLRQWPNFTRLLLTPEALRISALLRQGPRSPKELIDELSVRPDYVFALLSACHSLGWLAKSQRRIDATLAPEPPKTRKKTGLLGKLLRKLSRRQE